MKKFPFYSQKDMMDCGPTYHAGLHAECDIVTKDLRLLERFYYNTIRQLRITD